MFVTNCAVFNSQLTLLLCTWITKPVHGYTESAKLHHYY